MLLTIQTSQSGLFPHSSIVAQPRFSHSFYTLFSSAIRYIADTFSFTINLARLYKVHPLNHENRDAANIAPFTPSSSLSRRSLLSLLGATGLTALLASCDQTGNSANNRNLPDPFDTAKSGPSLLQDPSMAPPTPNGPLPAPPVAVEPKNTYGILPRSMWSKGGPNTAKVEPMDGVRLITFHHSGDPKPFNTTNFGETAQHLEYVRQYHRDQKFNDIGYHFAIDRAGRVWQLRSLRYQGQHVRYNNKNNIGVVVLGNFEIQKMSAAQQDKVKSFGLLLRKQYSLPIARVKTHQEIVSTECPGDNMQPFMKQIRKANLI